MSIKNFNILKIFLCLLVFNFATASDLNCQNLSASECKNEFGKIFDKESKAAHSTFSINMLEKFVEVYNNFLAELPENDLHRDPIKNLITKLNSEIEFFKQGHEDLELTVALMLLKIEKLEPDFEGLSFDADSKLRYSNLQKKYSEDIMICLSQEIDKISVHILNTWFKLYSALREIDLKTYPEFIEINLVFQGLKETEPKMRSMIYWGVVEKSTHFLELNYYKEILDKVQEWIRAKLRQKYN